jgi:1,2-diacylglycerol 3-alpha-glucosyltransferase
MRIGFFSDSYFPEVDGVTYTLEAWKNRLEDRGHEVYVIYPESSDYESGDREISIRSFSNPFYSGYNIPFPLFRDPYPDLDLVHCHSPAFIGISGLRYSSKKDLPAIYTHHTPIEEYFEQSVRSSLISRLLEKLYVPVESFLLGRFDVLTASTSEPRRPISFRKLPVGIDMEFFQPQENDFFEYMGLERPVIGYSGRISMEKNPGELLEMAKRFEGTLVIVGEGPLEEKVEEKKPDNVIRMQFLDREELPHFYSSLDVFVTASTGDTLGLSTLEANACGTPVVAPNVVPFEDTIGEGSGLLYEKGDPEDFRQKISKVLDARLDTRESVKEYSLSNTIDELEEIYREVS